MGFKQPIVPQYRSGESTEAYIRRLILFLKDFCQEAWMQSREQGKAIEALTDQAAQAQSLLAGDAADEETPQT